MATKEDREITTHCAYGNKCVLYKHSAKAKIPMQEWLGILTPESRDNFARTQLTRLNTFLKVRKCDTCKEGECYWGGTQERTFFPHGEGGDVVFEAYCEQHVPLTTTREKMDWLKLKLQNEDC
jgi:hypothetical protein